LDCEVWFSGYRFWFDSDLRCWHVCALIFWCLCVCGVQEWEFEALLVLIVGFGWR
jgi:hypothetical protein